MSPAVRNVFFTFSMDVFPAVWRIFFTFSMSISPAVWKFFFTFSMNISPVFRNGFFYSSIEHLIQSNVLESFLQLTYEKRKRDFKWMYISYYLNALQDIFRFFWRLHLFLAFFLLLSVLSSVKQFTNFYNYEELWGLCTNSFPFLRYLLSQSWPGDTQTNKWNKDSDEKLVYDLEVCKDCWHTLILISQGLKLR